MVSIHTNLSSLIAQGSLTKSTNTLNRAIEQMSTGYKINHASDNAANYSIKTNMDTKIGAYMVAEDNTAMGIDLLTTAESSLSLIGDKLARLRTLAVQSSNGTYGAESQKAINSEANALIDEMQRLHSTTEYNGKKILGDDNPNTSAVRRSNVDFKRRDTTNMKALGEIEDASVALADGTYSISTAAELAQLAEMPNAGLISEGDEFVWAANIDLVDYTTGEGWTPIGTKDNKFLGSFDGNGHTITNLYINRPSVKFQGLFGDSQGCIKNISVIDAEVVGNNCSAVLVGAQRGNSIENVFVSGSVETADSLAGGLVGQLGNASFASNVSNCSADVKLEGAYKVGGLVGSITSNSTLKIQDCNSFSEIQGEYNLGGFCGVLGSNSTLELNNCTAEAKINGSRQLGGFMGYSSNSTIIKIENSYSESQIISKNESTSGSFLGGFIGANQGELEIKNCFSNGSITGLADSNKHTYVGGFLGASSSDATGNLKITNCYSTVNIDISSPCIWGIGGFAGSLGSPGTECIIQNCYSTGDIKIENGVDTCCDIGGFTGYADRGIVTFDNCYNKGKIEIDTTNFSDYSWASFLGYIGGTGDIRIKNCHTFADPSSDTLAVWTTRNLAATFSIENSYHSQELADTSLPLFLDANGAAYYIDSELSQVKTCATDDPFKLYLNQETNLQVGIASGSSSNVMVDTTCSLKYMNVLRNIGLQEDDYLSKIDELMNDISLKQTQYGAANNRLLSAMEEINVQYENLVSSRSTIQDADMSEVSATYIQQQILQQASATLMATANQTPAIALQLL